MAPGDDLYVLPPREFTAARAERVAQARAAGDGSGAAALAALKRPTVGAWLVNLVALRRPASVARLVALGEELRTAQSELAGGPAAVRELSIRRREALEAVMSDLRELVAATGETPTPQQLGEAESTFGAALADAGAAELVRAGRVLKALTYSGFGAAPPVRASGPVRAGGSATEPVRAGGPATDRSGAAPGPPAGVATPRAVPPPPVPPEDLAERRAAAVVALDEARTALAAAVADERSAGAEVEELDRELAALRERHAAAQARARTARLARQAAEREVTTRERRLARLDRS